MIKYPYSNLLSADRIRNNYQPYPVTFAIMENNKDLVARASALIGRVQYQTIVKGGNHSLIADEPADKGGEDTGMDPYHLLLASLASCTAITLRMYVERKMWAIDEIAINLQLYKHKDGVTIESKLSFEGQLTDEQCKRLITIADACPVHKLLAGNVTINTSL